MEYGCIGERLGHSFSKEIHNALTDYKYELKELSKDEVTPLLRSRAKAVNFGIVYGMGDYSLSQDLHIPVKEAKAYIENYFEKYADVKKCLDQWEV